MQLSLKNRSFSRNKKLVLVGGLTLILAVAGYVVWQLVFSQIMPGRYQAVFLSNGQVYFGKLHDYYGSRPYMTDVYYFQAKEQADGKPSGDQTLVKLGKEIHAPEDKLILNKDSILFVENLQDSGSVVDAIKKDGQSSATNPPATGSVTR